MLLLCCQWWVYANDCLVSADWNVDQALWITVAGVSVKTQALCGQH